MRGHRSRRSLLALALLLGAAGSSQLAPVSAASPDGAVERLWTDGLPDALAPEPTHATAWTTRLVQIDRAERDHALGATGVFDRGEDVLPPGIVARIHVQGPRRHFGARLLGLPGHPATAPPGS